MDSGIGSARHITYLGEVRQTAEYVYREFTRQFVQDDERDMHFGGHVAWIDDGRSWNRAVVRLEPLHEVYLAPKSAEDGLNIFFSVQMIPNHSTRYVLFSVLVLDADRLAGDERSECAC